MSIGIGVWKYGYETSGSIGAWKYGYETSGSIGIGVW